MALIIKRDVITTLFILQLMGACSFSSARPSRTGGFTVDEIFKQWAVQHGKTYTDQAEKENRFRIFRENLKFIEEFNGSGNQTYRLGLNAFSDMTNEEFAATYTGNTMAPSRNSNKTGSLRINTDGPVPESVDWVKSGAVSSVKNQGRCGSCWAFTAAAAIESFVKIKAGGDLMDLSEQQLLDCVPDNNGCSGGRMVDAYDYVSKNFISADWRYPYRESKGECIPPLADAVIGGFEIVPSSSETDLMRAVAQQPVSVRITTTNDLFRSYKDGIFRADNCRTALDHTILIVGYGTVPEDGSKYWLLKNSWGKSWGQGGYMRIAREVPGVPDGVCGLAIDASYPI